MDRLKAMATFVRIVDSGSLSAAADASGQSHAAVVRSLAALEKHLGVRLLNRTTRRLALTDEGQEYLAWSRRILAEFDEVEQRYEASRDQPGGLLRLTAPVEFGRRHVAPLVTTFLACQPAMRADLILLDRLVDLVDEGLDLAIRIGHLPDSSMVALAAGRTRFVVCASPAYLAGAGPIETPAALGNHACITFLPQGQAWPFRDPDHVDGIRTETITARMASNQIQAVSHACQQGLGIARLLHYQVADELASGRLIRLLRAHESADVPIQLVYPHARLQAPRVRLFIDWVLPRLARSLPDPDD